MGRRPQAALGIDHEEETTMPQARTQRAARAARQTASQRPTPGFKPVALPALAAAVRAGSETPSRKPSDGDLPAVLRQDLALD